MVSVSPLLFLNGNCFYDVITHKDIKKCFPFFYVAVGSMGNRYCFSFSLCNTQITPQDEHEREAQFPV